MKTNLLHIFISLICVSVFSNHLMAANPEVVNGVATYHSNKTIGARFVVPNSWNKIIIKKNVTIKGNFIINNPARDFVIEGENWNTSILDNSMTTYVKGERQLCNIRFANHGSLLLKNFTSKNPANFHITAWAPVTIDHCRIIENRRQVSTDVAHSNHGVTILNSYISTYDDVTYVGECEYMYNTTIMHNKNGAPFMVSWGHNADGASMLVEKCTIIDNEASGVYHHGVVGWAREEPNHPFQTVTIEFKNCVYKTGAGKKKCEEFYSFGNNSYSITGAKVIQIGGECSWTSPIRLRNNSSNCSVVCQGGGGGSSEAPIGETIWLKGNNGKYVCSENGKKAIICNRTSVGNWEKFTVVNAGGGKIALKGNNGKYLNDGSPMWCTTNSITNTAKFTWTDAGNGKIALKGNNGKYVSSENGLAVMNCNRSSIGTWEKFTFNILKSATAESTELTDVEIYPNPASEQFTINGLKAGYGVKIFNTVGQIVYSNSATENGLQINTSEFSRGTYVVIIESTNKVITRKLIVD